MALHNLGEILRQAMYFFGFLAHSSESTTILFCVDTLEKALAMFFTHCLKNTYTTNDAHLRLIKWPSQTFPETNCYERELVICGYNLQTENYCCVNSQST